jgi:predicted DCC family thiol-disulfide oxidoreductase YuxK
MPELNRPVFSYRDDPAVAGFDDSRALFIFDGECVLCSGGASFLMKHDKARKINFTPASDPLGKSLYAHYGVDWNTTYLLIAQGRGYSASAGYLKLFALLGGPWHVLRVVALVPEKWRDAVYAIVARNRYRWFGTAEHCALLTSEQRKRLV